MLPMTISRTHIFGGIGAIVVMGLLAAGAAFVLRDNANPAWKGVRDSVLPQFVQSTVKNELPIITQPFSSNVDITYVIDGEDQYVFVQESQLQDWEIDIDTLNETAINNLEKQSVDVQIEVAFAGEDPRTTYAILELNDSYSAVKLLSGRIRKAVGSELGNEYFAAIPTRDFLIFWHKDFPLIDAFITQVKEEYASEEAYPITDEIFTVTRLGIQPVDALPIEQ